MTDHMQLQRKTVGQSSDAPTSVISSPATPTTTTLQLAPEPPAQAEPKAESAEPAPEQERQPALLNHDFGRIPILPKLSVSQPNDPYEQEADRVAAEVMRMPDRTPVPAASVQGSVGHDFGQIALSRQLEPIAQRKCAACKEEEKLSRKENGDAISHVGGLENKLAESQGGGEPLSDNVRGFMESRFGFDFSQIRIHTDASSVGMNESINAQAFTHRNDIYFNTGKYAPETQDGKQLLAHELTHTVQQTGGNPLSFTALEAESQASKTDRQPEHPSTEANQLEILQPSTQTSLMLWRMVQTKAKLHPMENGEAKLEDIQKQSSVSQIPDIQAKCSKCEEETIQRQTITPLTSEDEIVQTYSWDEFKNDVSSGAEAGLEWLGDRAEDIANWTGDQIADLVAHVAPELADFIRNNPIETIKTKVEDGIQSWLDGLFDGFDISGVIDDFTGRFDEMFTMARAFLSGDPESCAAVAEKLNSMTEFVKGIMDSPAIQAMQDAIATVSDIFQRVVDGFVAPVFDTLMDLVGGALSAVVDFAQDIWRWTEPVRRFIGNALSSAWNWVKEQLGFSTGEGDSEGGIVKWVKDKASEAWNFIKEKFAPVIEPIKKVLFVVVAISPVGWIAGAIKYGPQLIEMAKWLWNNRDNPDIVKSAHEEMGHTILPQLLSATQGFGDGLQDTVNSLIGTVTGFGKELLNVLGSIVNIPLLNMAKGLVQTVSDRIQTFIVWSQKTFQSVVQSVVRFAKSVKEKIEPYISVLSSLGMALINPASIPLVIAGAAWRLLPECYKGPIIDFLLDTLIEILSGMPDFPFFGLLWPLLKTGVLGFLRGLRKQSTEVKVAISNKIAKIISGGSPAFMLGFVKGLLKGIWEGIADPFLLIYDGITAVNDFQDWLTRSDTEARNPSGDQSGNQAEQSSDAEGESTRSQQPTQPDDDTDSSRQSDQEDDAEGRRNRGRNGFVQEVAQEASQNVLEVIIDRLMSMASELEPPVEDVSNNFMGAMQEVFKGAGDKMTFEDFVQMLGEIKQSIMNAIEEAGGRLANQVCEFMMQDEAEGKIGEGAGYLAGTIVFEVVLAVLTAGGGTAAKAVVRVARQITRVLDRQGEAMRMVSRNMKTLGKHLDDILGSLRKLVSKAGGKAEEVMQRMGVIGDILRRYSDELLELLMGDVPLPGGRRDRDGETPEPDSSPERDADGTPDQDSDDAREGDRDPASPQPGRGDDTNEPQPDERTTPTNEPDPQQPRDREDNPTSTSDSPRDLDNNQNPDTPRTDETDQPNQPRRDQDTPEQHPRDRENDADSTPDPELDNRHKPDEPQTDRDNDPDKDAKVRRGLRQIPKEEVRYLENGAITQENAEKVAATIKARNPVFKVLKVVDGEKTWDYKYIGCSGTFDGSRQAEQEFEPIEKIAHMHNGQETVKIVAEGAKLKLLISNQQFQEIFGKILRGPLKRSINTSGEKLVGETVQEIQRTIRIEISRATLKEGKLSVSEIHQLDQEASKIADKLENLGEKMKISGLDRAAIIEPIDTISIDCRYESTGNTLYDRQFREELERQLVLQQDGINQMTIDQWIINRSVFKMDESLFEMLDESARVAVLRSLRDRGYSEIKTRIYSPARGRSGVRKRRRNYVQELGNIVPNLHKQERNGDEIIQIEEHRFLRTEEIKQTRGRFGNEDVWREKHLDGIKELAKDPRWSELVKSSSDLPVLHNPDQVAGGFGQIPDIGDAPNQGTPEWEEYLQKLRQYVGPGKVNSYIGWRFWPRVIMELQNQVISGYPQEAWAIWRMNVELNAKQVQ